MTENPRSGLAIPVVLAGALLWGIYWVPVRELTALGLTGAWAGLALSAVAVPAMAAVALIRPGPQLAPRALLGAVAIGAALSLYGAALAYTDVIRAILIFYLAPAWSVLIEAAFLGRRLSWRSGFAVAISLLGIAVICRGEVPLEGIGALGDWLALASGISWSVAAALLFSARAPDIRRTGLWVMVSAVAISLTVALLDPAETDAIPARATALTALPEALIYGLAFNLPVILTTIWGAMRLRPATVTFLLTAEIISGVVSSAVLLDEPFAWWEVGGTALIITGALIEILFPPRLRATS